MKIKLKSRALFIVFVVLLLVWLALTLITEFNLVHAKQPTIPELLQKKTEQTARERAQGEALPEVNGYQIGRIQAPQPSWSGMKESVMLLRDTQFNYYGNLGYTVDSLSLSITANTVGQPAWLDDPKTYKFTLHQGKIRLSSVQLDAMMNRILNPPRSPLKNLKTSFQNGQLYLTGQMQRKGKWSEFSMLGMLLRVDDKTLKFHPTQIKIGGQSADSLMAQVSLTVSDLISIQLPEAQLKGNDLYINLDKSFPAPLLDVHAKNIAITDQGLNIEFYNPNVANPPIVPETLAGSKTFIQVLGGDVQFMKAHMVNARVIILPEQTGDPVKFELYRYQSQLTRAIMRTNTEGVMTVFMPAPLPQSGDQK